MIIVVDFTTGWRLVSRSLSVAVQDGLADGLLQGKADQMYGLACSRHDRHTLSTTSLSTLYLFFDVPESDNVHSDFSK